MIVVQPFAGSEKREEAEVGRRVVKVLVAETVTETVDRRREHKHVKHHVSTCRYQAPADTECGAQDEYSEPQTEKAVVEHLRVPPAFHDALAVAFEFTALFQQPRFAHVVVDVPELDFPESLEERTVRIALFVRERVVFAMHCNPLLGTLTGSEPDHELEEPLHCRLESERHMRSAPVEIDGRRDTSNLCDDETSRKCL